jgi:photosynthetic reaction center H subunit
LIIDAKGTAMHNVVIAGNIDIAMLALWAFFIFFIALVIYLHRESYREGYPLEDPVSGRYSDANSLFPLPDAKTFNLPNGGRSVTVPQPNRREPVEIAAKRMDRSPGSPYVPTGNPMIDGVGPAAWAERAKVPDLDMHGAPRIAPLASTDLWLESRDPDPRGMTVTGADGAVAGTVSEVWVDRMERMVRYLAIDTGKRTVIAPMTVAVIHRATGTVEISAILASQFADAPALAKGDVITLYEEERVQAYFGGGYLYATPERQESCI